MNPTNIILSLLVGRTAANAASSTRGASAGGDAAANEIVYKDHHQFERALSGSGDVMSFDDDFWSYDQRSMDTYWADYSIMPKKCMILNNKSYIAFTMYGKGHNSCTKKKEDTYLMEVGKFAKAYVGQKQLDYKYMGNNYGNPDALNYLTCTAVAYNDAYYYAKLGCTNQGGLKIYSYTDENCSQTTNTNIGLYNDIKISFNSCQSCVTWPKQTNDDDAEAIEVDDNFDNYHGYDSKLCGAADQFKENCGWGCQREVKKSSSSSSSNYNSKRSWGGFEKFCLCFWSFAMVLSVWLVLKQRRLMSREYAIVEEAAMNGVGLKKRHVFPISLGVVFFILLAMFMVWKKLTWILLIGTNVGLFAHFVYLRRKAKKAGNGGEGYIKDAGLEIS
ncbi:hypothetical protein ACHAWU_002617 [Discostella pseudostelligera]|uniref:Uncharacterized protein n=1 Tax=Discostella pseudostelligera TaxID=259834 RepID=A0ABD3MQ83_9STRA